MIRCAGCGNTIEGRYVKAVGRNWHTACFRCDECGAKLNAEYHKVDGHKLCPSCFAAGHAPRCAVCGEPVLGQYATAQGGTYHPECLTCSVCKKPLTGATFHEHQGQFVCAGCFEENYAPHCDVCGITLRGEFKLDAWGNRFCERHLERPGLCEFCGRIISEKTTGGGVYHEDGRDVCAICTKSGVDSPGLVESFATLVRQFFEKRGFGLQDVEAPAVLPIKIVDRGDMPSASYGQDQFGVTVSRENVLNGKVISRKVEAIYLLAGMPMEKLCETYAHEYGHAWLFLHGYPKLDLQSEEGLAQLFAHMWLTERGTVDSAVLKQIAEKSTDRVYGDGLRRALKAQRRMGLREMLAYAKRHGSLP